MCWARRNTIASILELYNSFHWQGGTVATFHIAMEAHNLRLAMPFRDYGLLNYLAYMPEHFGRGLELRPTKFPLKWTVENRLDYPMDLQTGPHSYTYDVDPRFTHYGELVNHSALRPIFTEVLGQQDTLNGSTHVILIWTTLNLMLRTILQVMKCHRIHKLM